MLPASGYFKDIDCPYYDNFCGRPYCHFRHRKRNQDPTEDQEGDMITTEIPTYNPTPKSELEKTKSHIPISYVPDTVIRPERINRINTAYNYAEKITYKPTPLSELSKNNTIQLINKELFNITHKNDEETVSSENEMKISDDCDIDFEELSTEMDMIDDIINESPTIEDNNKSLEGEVQQQKENPRKGENPDQSNKSSSKSSKSSTKSSSSKSKEEKSSRHSSKSSSSTHKSSSHKSKSSENHKSHSSEKSKEKSSDLKHKDDKKRDKDRDRHKSSTSHKKESESKNNERHKESESKNNDRHKESESKNNERHKDKESKSSSSRHSSSSKHKEYHKSKKKEKNKETKSSSKEREKKESKSERKLSIEDESSKYKLKDMSDNEDNGYDDIFSEDLEEECYKIFNEYKPEVVNRPKPEENEKAEEVIEEYVPTSKKRVAHFGADQYIPKISHTKPKATQSAALQMANRYKVARETTLNDEDDIVAALNKHGTKRQSLILETYKSMKKARLKESIQNHVEKSSPQIQSTSFIDDIINGKPSNEITYKPTPISKLNAEDVKLKPKRIAPAMNVSSIQQAKAKLAEIAKKRETTPKTPIQTISKGNKRVAHIPDTSLGELPDVLQPENKKIPVNVRTRYLTMLADECVKLYLSRDDAYNRAVNEEFKVLERCAAIVTYRNSAMLAINRVRKELLDRESKGLGPISSGESSNSNPDSQYKGKKFYDSIMPYVLQESDLEEQGYPREGSIPGKAVIKTQKQLPRVNLDGNQRLCCRCFKVYLVDDVGFPVYDDECIYHPLKKRTLKGDRIYLCCKSTEETGCMTSNTHVSESEEIDLLGYQMTMDPERDDDSRSHSVYALDCEMCYTTRGLELTRVTIIDPDCKTVYDSLVKPLNPIIDYNTQFSGITKEQMDRTSTNILQVQANILHLCNSRTILIGHSLESDMKALKIIHTCIIDTAMLFPHRLGLPHKRALRVLASEYLKKIIQSDVGGHDSTEDAITCMQLVVWKLKEDLKVRGIK